MNNVRVAFRPAPSLSSAPAGAGAAGAHYPVVRASGTFFTQFPFPSSISHFRFPTRFLIGYIFSERRYRGAHLQRRKPGPREIEELDSGRRAGIRVESSLNARREDSAPRPLLLNTRSSTLEHCFESGACPSSRNYGIIIKICWDPGIFFFVSVPGAPGTQHLPPVRRGRSPGIGSRGVSAAWSPFSLLTLSMSPSAELRHASPREAVEASGEVPDAQAPCAAHTSSIALADASGFLPPEWRRVRGQEPAAGTPPA